MLLIGFSEIISVNQLSYNLTKSYRIFGKNISFDNTNVTFNS